MSREPQTSQVLTDEAIRDLERNNLLAALERAGGKIYGAGGAAELLGMKPTTVASRTSASPLRPDPPAPAGFIQRFFPQPPRAPR